ncbi:hypothetical protein ZIOFF_068349 [Zingiber officinale]|uniref:MLO-like protein n=1 Tax=Zingiber officinale TaxID=94328 RepID=A0A8J5CGJ7_ZINOF|nr:hypothetical protein ZIOFF_068349 [Zingiber officinale]
MDLSTAMWTATVVGAIAVYWFVWVMGSAEVKGKRAVNLKMGSIMREKVQDKYKQYWSFFLCSKEGIAAASDDDNVPAFVDTFYNLVTDIYEWGWGQSFHFSPSLPGRSHREATCIHEEPADDLRDGDLISQIPIRGRSLLLPFTITDPVRDHVPIMLGEVLDTFRSLRLRSFVNCTLGAAGHSAAIIDVHPELELFVGMDMDASIHDQAWARIEKLLAVDSRGSKLKAYTHVRNFKYIKSVLGDVDENLLDVGVNDILMDLGISSMQVDDSTRGFSVQGDGPLDMRMNPQPRNVSFLFPLLISSHHIMQTCFFRQFGKSVVRADYLTLRQGFILNHNLTPRYDFHSYMIRSMEEEFKRIVGALIFNSCIAQLWGFVVAFMLFNINGSNLYFWIAIILVTVDTLLIICVVSAHQIKEGMGYLQFLCRLMKLVLSVGAKLQHVIATLVLESAGLSGFGARLNPRDDLIWFKKP